MPNSATLSSWVETAAKWSGTAFSPTAPAIQARALAALVIVSWVVKVFDETMNKVLAGSRPRNVSPMSAPSTLDTKWLRSNGGENGDNARVAIAGPRSEPPMPILMTSVIGWPRAPRTRPSRTSAAKWSIFSRVRDDVRHDVVSIDQDRRAGEIAQCGVQDGAVLGDVDFLSGEHRVTPGLDPARLGELDERPQNGGVDALLGKIKQEIAEGDAELLKSRRIVGEVRSRRTREHARAHAGQFCQCS